MDCSIPDFKFKFDATGLRHQDGPVPLMVICFSVYQGIKLSRCPFLPVVTGMSHIIYICPFIVINELNFIFTIFGEFDWVKTLRI
jgi:hypothetical protein